MNLSLCIYGNGAEEQFHKLESFLLFIRGNSQIGAATFLIAWDKLQFIKAVGSDRYFRKSGRNRSAVESEIPQTGYNGNA